MCIYTYIYIYTHTYTRIHIHTHTHLCMHVTTNACINSLVRSFVQLYMHACINPVNSVQFSTYTNLGIHKCALYAFSCLVYSCVLTCRVSREDQPVMFIVSAEGLLWRTRELPNMVADVFMSTSKSNI